MTESPTPAAVPITDEREMRIWIDQAASSQVSVGVQIGPAESGVLRLKVQDASSYAQGIEIALDPPTAKKMLQKTGECLLMLYLKGQLLIGIHSNQWRVDGPKLTVSRPWRMFKIQRRREVRVPIHAGYEVMAEFTAIEGARGRIKRRVLDVSVSGLSIHFISSREALWYRKGLMIKNLVFKLQERVISVDAQIMSSVELQGALSGTKTGIKFLRISKPDRDFIYAYVAKHLSSPALGI